MIKFESGMLVLDNTAIKEDVHAINDFVEHVRKQEQHRIVKILEEEAERNACSCGDVCTAYDNGFEDAIFTIKDLAECPIVE